jgi:hypothetical protein
MYGSEKGERLIDKYPDVIDSFFRIAERRVTVLDEYGDENWKAVDREIERCIDKLATREVGEDWRRTGLSLEQYSMKRSLLVRFKAYHESQQHCRVTPAQVATMGGVEFEGYVMRLLKRRGCVVSGTPQSGDKGGTRHTVS